jgi:streptogramin lyase
MSEEPSLIMIQFLAWVADRPRNYVQTMEAWRSSCPRLSVWEDAIIEGLVRIESNANRTVRLTKRGSAVLEHAQPQTAAAAENKAPRIKVRPKTPVVAHCAAF